MGPALRAGAALQAGEHGDRVRAFVSGNLDGAPRRHTLTRTGTIRPEGGEETTDTAKYVVVWKRDAGGGRWAIDIWNANA
jgi:hypothetical protein